MVGAVNQRALNQAAAFAERMRAAGAQRVVVGSIVVEFTRSATVVEEHTGPQEARNPEEFAREERARAEALLFHSAT